MTKSLIGHLILISFITATSIGAQSHKAQSNLSSAEDKSMRDQMLKQANSIETKSFDDHIAMVGRLISPKELGLLKTELKQGAERPGVMFFRTVGATAYLSERCNAGNDWKKEIDQSVELQVPPGPMRQTLKTAAEDGWKISEKHLKAKQIDCSKISKTVKTAGQ